MHDVTLLDEQEIAFPVPLTRCRLVPGCEGDVGLPIEAFLRLYVVREGEEAVLIRDPQDVLQWVTRIRNEQDVWHILRLFTSPETHYLFQRDAFVVDASPVSGEPKQAGEISLQSARALGLLPPRIRHEGGVYTAERDLLRQETGRRAGPIRAVRRTEAVSEDRRYRWLGDEVLGPVSEADVRMPAYE